MFQAAGWLVRAGTQFHWRNAGYASFDDFLGCLASRKRKAIRKERAAAVDGLTIRHVSGSDITEADWDAFWYFYQDTGSRKWGQPYLTRHFFSLLGKRMADKVLPKSILGEAVGFCHNQWAKLTAFLMDGRLELDNNRSERAIKPFVIGRKNWLFSNTPRGAKASATIYSIIETAKENGLNPLSYLTYLFEQLPNIDLKDPKALDLLLPWAEAVQAQCRVPAKPAG